MRVEHVTALKQLASMLQTGQIHGGSITQRAQFVVAIEQGILSDGYWHARCIAAEKYIKESPCDPDTTCDQIEAHKNWEKIKAELL